MVEKNAKSIVKSFPLLTTLVLFTSGLCFVFPGIGSVSIFDRNAVLQGEVWRLVSSHFVHFTGTHLAYNLTVFAVVGWLVERERHLYFAILFVSMAMVISGSLFILRPAMIYYGGLSGIACGFIYYYSLVQVTKSGHWKMICKSIILLLPLKIFIEIYNNASTLPYWGNQAFVLMPLSHVSGIAVALLFYFTIRGSKRHSNHRLKKDWPFRCAPWPTS